VAVTQTYLDTSINKSFGLNPSLTVKSLTITPRGSTSASGTAQVGFDLAVTFAAGTGLPTQADLDVLVATAFSNPAVQALLTSLGQLTTTNPFSTTASVSYSTTNVPLAASNLAPPGEKSKMLPLVGSILGAFGLLTVTVNALMFYEKKHRGRVQRDFVDPDGKAKSHVESTSVSDDDTGEDDSHSIGSTEDSRSICSEEGMDSESVSDETRSQSSGGSVVDIRSVCSEHDDTWHASYNTPSPSSVNEPSDASLLLASILDGEDDLPAFGSDTDDATVEEPTWLCTVASLM
jgi:hypothetical protein